MMEVAEILEERGTFSELDEEDEENEGQIENWDDWASSSDWSGSGDLLCLFCESRFDSSESLFCHCISDHSFDFDGIRRDLDLDFYDSLKLVNYVRSQVAISKCWLCGSSFEHKEVPSSHAHVKAELAKGDTFPWLDDFYLKPFLADDALLHSLTFDDGEENHDTPVNGDKMPRELMRSDEVAEIFLNEGSIFAPQNENGNSSEGSCCASDSLRDAYNGNGVIEYHKTTMPTGKDKQLKIAFANAAAREIKKVDEDYFGAYGSFGIHREMLSDRIRTDAYRDAILNNPSLMMGATVMDVGCGTGILSLFAAQAGASNVIAVEASKKMASIAAQIARDNKLQYEKSETCEGKKLSGVTVVNCTVEELEKFIEIPKNSFDVLVSEWMGYCLLYESMLSSVLYARDCWLKPGGAILPDSATMFVAGFGKGGTSLPFWENVYGFDMSCIGKEVLEDSAKAPIVDVIDSTDIITESSVLQVFDLTAMELDDVDFTTTVNLIPKPDLHPGNSSSPKPVITWCFGVALWFEAGFTSRFCKELTTTLSTSPHSKPTHWSQSIFTFREPIALASSESSTLDAVLGEGGFEVGTEQCPAIRISCRISLARSLAHRSIDVSLEATGVGLDGRKNRKPVQTFSL